jgi:hypothetical protein
MPDAPAIELYVPRLGDLLADLAGARERFPALARWLARGSAAYHAGTDIEQSLCVRFGVARQSDWPIAPLTLVADGGAPGDGYWLRADPAWLQATRGDLVLARVGDLGLVQADADALVAALDAHFRADGLRFIAPLSERWYVRLPASPELETTPAHAALGRSVDASLPRGTEALAWHRRLNEMQMLLHGHAVNDAREARGEPPVNSVWLWGGGAAPQCAAPPGLAMWSDAPVARGLALCARARCAALPADVTPLLDADDAVRIAVLDLPAAPAAASDRWQSLHDRWLAPLVEAVRRGGVRSAALVLERGEGLWRFTLSRADLWKLWRRPPAWLPFAHAHA